MIFKYFRKLMKGIFRKRPDDVRFVEHWFEHNTLEINRYLELMKSQSISDIGREYLEEFVQNICRIIYLNVESILKKMQVQNCPELLIEIVVDLKRNLRSF
jgi:hypothetical protein